MKRIFPGKRKFQLKALSGKHHEIKRLDSLGVPKKEIAKLMGCTEVNISQITGSEIYKDAADVLRTAMDSSTVEVAKVINRLGMKSLKLLEEVVDGTGKGRTADLAMQVKVAMNTIDRLPGAAKIQSVQGKIEHSHSASDELIEQIKERAKQAKRAAISSAAVSIVEANKPIGADMLSE